MGTQAVTLPSDSDAHPRGYWTMEKDSKNNNVRMFFDQLAFEKHRDPLVPETWYDISWKEIGEKKGHGILNHYNTVVKALSDAYPEIPFQEHRFSRVSRNHWNSAANRRKFFDSIAQENSFDPLSPESWYALATSDMFSKYKGIWNVIERHNFSYETALIELYPEIGLSVPAFKLWRKYNKFTPK